MYAVITENDVSEWKDKTGKLYHFPSRYLRILHPGAQIIYYKGKQTSREFSNFRLTGKPHYFGTGEIGRVYKDPNSSKADYFAEIEHFQIFERPILLKKDNQYLENVPVPISNYFRNGVRKISKEIYDKILSQSNIVIESDFNNELISIYKEGKNKIVYSTKYERNAKLRQQALELHGYTCQVCGFNFFENYGEIGRDFIHVHHINPLSVVGEQVVNPKTDLVPVCPNCHCIIHRSKSHILTIEELKAIAKKYKS